MNSEEKIQFIKENIETIPDYPIPGVLFRDITTLLNNPTAYQTTIDLFIKNYIDKDITKIASAEARGFLFGAPLSLHLGVGFVPVRKKGKLPRATLQKDYTLEYSRNILEIHQDSISRKDTILVVDDLLATGGTVRAVVALIRELGGRVNEAAFVVCLPDLGGIDRLKEESITCFSLVEFSGDESLCFKKYTR